MEVGQKREKGKAMGRKGKMEMGRKEAKRRGENEVWREGGNLREKKKETGWVGWNGLGRVKREHQRNLREERKRIRGMSK